ncbi:MAG: hypothetical protein ACRDT2_01980 [Natronosporangium sp.]
MTTRRVSKPQDDQPFDFNLDAVESEVALTPFRFHWGGRRWEMAHAEGLDMWHILPHADAGDVKAMAAALEIALGKQKYEQFQKIPMPKYKVNALFEAYQRHCGVEPGESQGSVNS